MSKTQKWKKVSKASLNLCGDDDAQIKKNVAPLDGVAEAVCASIEAQKGVEAVLCISTDVVGDGCGVAKGDEDERGLKGVEAVLGVSTDVVGDGSGVVNGEEDGSGLGDVAGVVGDDVESTKKIGRPIDGASVGVDGKEEEDEKVLKGAITLAAAVDAVVECVGIDGKEEEDEIGLKGTTPPTTALATGVVGGGAEEGALDVMDDWDVARLLGCRRRILHYIRHEHSIGRTRRPALKSYHLKNIGGGSEAVRGVDWDCVDGEVGMTRQWCALNGVKARIRAGQRGYVSCVMHSRTKTPFVVICLREDDGVAIPVRLDVASSYMQGALIEARKSMSYVLAYKIPRKGY